MHVPGGATPAALNASGRSGSGADAAALRERGFHEMPVLGDVGAVPVPGCVDGWLALHDRFGRLALPRVLEPAVAYAADGFPSTHLLVASARSVAGLQGAEDFAAAARAGVAGPAAKAGPDAPGDRRGRPGRVLRGRVRLGLVALGAGQYTGEDLASPHADWVEPLHVDAFGRRLWTVPPNSQGYLTLAGAWIADGLELPEDPEDPLWPHLLIEAARQAAYDRIEVLHEHADGQALVGPDRLAPRRAAIDRRRAAALGGGESYRPGGTTFLCCVDETGIGRLAHPVQRRRLRQRPRRAQDGHLPAEPGDRLLARSGTPGRVRAGPAPAPHALPSARHRRLRRAADGDRHDGRRLQPQILLQLLARILSHQEPVGDAIAAPRWALRGAGGADRGFSAWADRGRVEVDLEPGGAGASGRPGSSGSATG